MKSDDLKADDLYVAHVDHDWRSLLNPPRSGWQAKLTPGGYVTFRPTVGNVPCWFHRQMQRLCFGIVWERVK